MYGYEVEKIILNQKSSSKIFQGVYSANNLPKRDKCLFPSAYIANTAEDYKQGEHWVSFYFDSPNNQKLSITMPEYFDPYGLLPLRQSFLDFMGKPFFYSTHLIQSPLSLTCGHYAIYYIIKRSEGNSLQQIVSSFTNDTKWNDEFVTRYVDKLKRK